MESCASPTRGAAGGGVVRGHAAPPPAILDCQDRSRMRALADNLRASGCPEAAQSIIKFAASPGLPSAFVALTRLREVPATVLSAIPETRPVAAIPCSQGNDEHTRRRRRRRSA
jgi:hypothetical protein